jgi:hypothetical protein
VDGDTWCGSSCIGNTDIAKDFWFFDAAASLVDDVTFFGNGEVRMRYLMTLIMAAIFPSLAGDIVGDKFPFLSPGILRSVATETPAQKNNTVSLQQVSVEEYYKEDQKVEDVLASYYEDRR